MRTIYGSLLIGLVLSVGLTSLPAPSVVSAQSPAKKKATDVAPVYTVDSYDPKRDPAEDLKATIEKAKSQDKRILVKVGGQWCSWCHLMKKYFQDNPKVAKALADDYLIVLVNYSDDNKNEDFLGTYPKISGYPHLFVLDSDGKLLHSQDTVKLEKGKTYDERAMLTFLKKWAK